MVNLDNIKIISWIQQSVATENCKITIEGASNELNGFIGDIIFAKIDLREEKRELYLAVKIGKTNPEVRKQIPIRKLCEKEIFFYSKILPVFNNFQNEKKVKNVFNAVPKCYRTFLDDNNEVIVLENLKKSGFELHNASEPLNLNHIRIGLKNLAKFHAVSLALRDQRRLAFDELTSNLRSTNRPKNAGTYLKAGRKIIQNLKTARRNDLAISFSELVEKGLENILIEFIDDSPEERVVIHNDCHNNNIFFKYEDDTKENPSNMVFLDFQLTSLHSPVADLSYFLYMGASKNEFPHFLEVMEYYHKELSSALQQLGSDPNILFPISTLWAHWKKYSGYGFAMAILSLEVFFLKTEDALSIRSNKEGSVLEKLSMLTNSNEAYLERLAAVIDHHLNFKFD